MTGQKGAGCAASQHGALDGTSHGVMDVGYVTVCHWLCQELYEGVMVINISFQNRDVVMSSGNNFYKYLGDITCIFLINMHPEVFFKILVRNILKS